MQRERPDPVRTSYAAIWRVAMTCAMRVLVLGALLPILSACHAAGTPRGKTGTMEHYSIQLGDCVLDIHAPGGQSRAFPDHVVPQRVNLTDSTFDDLGRGPDLFRRSWDFGGGAFSAPEGSLTIYVALKKAGEPMRGLDDLQAVIVSGSEQFDRSRGFSSDYDMPIEFRPATVAGRQGWYVRYKVSRPNRVVMVDERHYLVVGANISGLAQHSKWRPKAESISSAVLNSMKLTACASPKQAAVWESESAERGHP